MVMTNYKKRYELEAVKSTLWRRITGIYRWGTDNEKDIVSAILEKEYDFQFHTIDSIEEKSEDINVMYFKILNRRGGGKGSYVTH